MIIKVWLRSGDSAGGCVQKETIVLVHHLNNLARTFTYAHQSNKLHDYMRVDPDCAKCKIYADKQVKKVDDEEKARARSRREEDEEYKEQRRGKKKQKRKG